jgi:hypothetical protein
MLIWVYVGLSLQRMVSKAAVGNSFNVVFTLNLVIVLIFCLNLMGVIVGFNTNVYYIFIMPDWWTLFAHIVPPLCAGNFLLIRLMMTSLKYEDRIGSSLLTSSTSYSLLDGFQIALMPESLFEDAEALGDEDSVGRSLSSPMLDEHH